MKRSIAEPHEGSGSPRQRRSPAAMAALKAEMLVRARAIYRDEGVGALSMRRMAEEFSISPMALYSYFPSKQALLNSLWVEVFESLLTLLLGLSEGRRGPVKVLEAHLRGFIAFWEQWPDQYRMIYVAAQEGDNPSEVDIVQQPVYRQLVNLTRERVSACSLGEPDEARQRLATDQVVAMLLGYLQLSVGLRRYGLRDREALRERMIAEMLRAVRELLGAP